MKQLICHLKNLICHHCDERDGDELFIKFNGKRIWPEKKKYIKGTDSCVLPIDIELPIEGSGKVVLQLWDYDLISDDLLGEFNFLADGDGQFASDLKIHGSGAHKFTLEFAVNTVRKQGVHR